MVLQNIKDNKGKDTDVFIPINYWKKLKKQNASLASLENPEPDKARLLQELRDAVIELKQIEEGKIIARLAKDFLNEL